MAEESKGDAETTLDKNSAATEDAGMAVSVTGASSFDSSAAERLTELSAMMSHFCSPIGGSSPSAHVTTARRPIELPPGE